MRVLLYVIRHGHPDYATDSLTPLGEAQAAALPARFRPHGLDRIFSSPLGRAQATARPTAKALGLPVETEEWCSESLAWHEFALPFPDGHRRWIFDLPAARLRREGIPPEYLAQIRYEEGYARLRRDSDAFLERLGYRREGGLYRILRPSEERIALFCHAGCSRIWFPHLLDVDPVWFWTAFDLTHAGIIVVHFENVPEGLTAPRCLAWSDTGPLFHAGLELEYNAHLPF
jgi:probable phosphoglycerate mutase